MESAALLAGQCLCGQVQYRISAPAKWCAHCHCSLCQRAHGAAFVTWFGVPFNAFRIMAGEACLRWYESSPQGKRAFCSHCGTPMLFHGTRWADEMHIARATLTTPLHLLPEAHVYYGSHVDWVQCDDHLPRFNDPDAQAL